MQHWADFDQVLTGIAGFVTGEHEKKKKKNKWEEDVAARG
jgi:hypothetical protein